MSTLSMKAHTKEPAELRQLALDIAEGKVFGSWMLPKGQIDLMGSIFMVLVLGGADKLPEDTAHLYEYMTEAGSRSINGYPMFLSCHFLTKADMDVLGPLVDEVQALRARFVGGSTT